MVDRSRRGKARGSHLVAAARSCASLVLLRGAGAHRQTRAGFTCADFTCASPFVAEEVIPVSLAAAGGSKLELFKASYVTYGSGEPRAYFKSTMSTDFVADAPRVEVTFPVHASNLYVLDCPISGSGDGHYRVSFAPSGAGFAIRDTHPRAGLRMLATYLADRDGEVRVALEGHTLDGEDYLWVFAGCRLSTIAYGSK